MFFKGGFDEGIKKHRTLKSVVVKPYTAKCFNLTFDLHGELFPQGISLCRIMCKIGTLCLHVNRERSLRFS
jgi:hypothetical protein